MALLLTVNEENREFPDLPEGSTLRQVLTALGLALDRVAVELNGTISPRSGWDSQAVQNRDRLEIVHFVGGGAA